MAVMEFGTSKYVPGEILPHPPFIEGGIMFTQNGKVRAHIVLQRTVSGYSFAIDFVKKEDGAEYHAKPVKLEWEKLPPNGFLPEEPSIALEKEDGREVMEALALAMDQFGLFKSKDEKEMKAIKAHLEDMRRLVFKEE